MGEKIKHIHVFSMTRGWFVIGWDSLLGWGCRVRHVASMEMEAAQNPSQRRWKSFWGLKHGAQDGFRRFNVSFCVHSFWAYNTS